MAVIIAVGAFLVVGYFALRAFAVAEPRQVAWVLRWGAVALAAGVAMFMIARGQFGTVLMLGAMLAPILLRNGVLARLRRGLDPPESGRQSRVETEWLRMTLDHDSGVMSGEVLAGPFAGRGLATLTPEELVGLRQSLLGRDPRSATLLEAWLERAGIDWRDGAEAAGAGTAGRRGREGAMTREDAAAILGIPADSPPEAIRQAHRKLMLRVHPDVGGSDYLAAEINRAKDILLKG